MFRQAFVLLTALTLGSVFAVPTQAEPFPINFEAKAYVKLYRDDPGDNIAFFGGGVATVNSTGGIGGHLDSIHVDQDRGLVEGSYFFLITDPDQAGLGVAAFDYRGFRGVSGTMFGSFTTPSRQTLPAPVPVRGTVRVCFLSRDCTLYLAIDMTQPTTTINGALGGGIKGLGVGGLITAGGFGGLRFSIQHAPWTIHTATGINHVVTESGVGGISVFQTTGSAHGPLGISSSTAQPGGSIKMVSPSIVVTNMPNPGSGWGNAGKSVTDQMGVTSILEITFVPEPGILLLLTSGVVGLVMLSRKRMKR